MERIRIQFTLFSAFYSPLISAMSGVVHFAQVNEMDGFFLTARKADPGFSWKQLEGAELVTFKGGQPHAMFKYAYFSPIAALDAT